MADVARFGSPCLGVKVYKVPPRSPEALGHKPALPRADSLPKPCSRWVAHQHLARKAIHSGRGAVRRRVWFVRVHACVDIIGTCVYLNECVHVHGIALSRSHHVYMRLRGMLNLLPLSLEWPDFSKY